MRLADHRCEVASETVTRATPQVEEELDVPCRAKKRGERRRNKPPRGPPLNKRAQPLEDLQMDKAVPDDTALSHPLAASLKLRLDQGDQIPLLMSNRTKRWQDQAKRNERDIDRDQINPLTDILQGEVAGIEAFVHHHTTVVPEPPVELPLAYVHAVDALGTVLKETIGEAAGGTANVQTEPPRGINTKGGEGPFQFLPAAADVGQGRHHLDDGLGIHPMPGPIHGVSVDANPPGHDHTLGTRTAADQTPLRHKPIETFFCCTHLCWACHHLSCLLERDDPFP